MDFRKKFSSAFRLFCIILCDAAPAKSTYDLDFTRVKNNIMMIAVVLGGLECLIITSILMFVSVKTLSY